MAKKPLSLSANGRPVVTFEMREVRRESLYGSRQRLNLDESGNPCTWGQITPDGMLIRAGMLGTWTPEDEPEGAVVPSAHEVPPTMLPCHSRDILDCAVEKLFELTATAIEDWVKNVLESGVCFKTRYNLSATAEPHDAYLVANEHGLFLLVGRNVPPAWTRAEDVPEFDDDDAIEDDFETLI